MSKREFEINENIAATLFIGIVMLLLTAIIAGFAYTYILKDIEVESRGIVLKAEGMVETELLFAGESLQGRSVRILPHGDFEAMAT